MTNLSVSIVALRPKAAMIRYEQENHIHARWWGTLTELCLAPRAHETHLDLDDRWGFSWLPLTLLGGYDICS